MKTNELDIDFQAPITKVGGDYEIRVMQVTRKAPDGTPLEWHQVGEPVAKRNLILPAGRGAGTPLGAYALGASALWTYCHVGTGSTPNKATLDGTFAQTGTTVTRATGAGVFVSGNVNDWIKFASGETAKIISYTNPLTVEVNRSRTVAAAALTVYDTSRVTLDTWVKSGATADAAPTAKGYTQASDTGISTCWMTKNMTVETAPRTYTEFGISTDSSGATQLFSRIVFDTPVAVAIDQFIQVQYTIRQTLAAYRVSTPITMAITGWPHSYAIQSITSNGTYWDVVVDSTVNDHYVVGRTFTIAGALPATTVISGITSTATEFVVTATAHGKTAGQSIVIAGATPAGYNGTWTVASATANTITVTSAANLGAGSGGTVRLSTPGTWYDGTHTIASFPNATTIRITNAASIVAAGIAGTAKNSLAANAIVTGWGFRVIDDGWFEKNGPADCTSYGSTEGRITMKLLTEAQLQSGMQYGVRKTYATPLQTKVQTGSGVTNTTNLTHTSTFDIASGEAISKSIRQIYFEHSTGEFWITFDERQRKDNGYKLTINLVQSWEPELN